MSEPLLITWLPTRSWRLRSLHPLADTARSSRLSEKRILMLMNVEIPKNSCSIGFYYVSCWSTNPACNRKTAPQLLHILLESDSEETQCNMSTNLSICNLSRDCNKLLNQVKKTIFAFKSAVFDNNLGYFT